MVTGCQLFQNLPFGTPADVACNKGQVWVSCCLPRSREESWGVIWSIKEVKGVVYLPIFKFFTFCIQVFLTPAWGVTVKVPNNDAVRCRGDIHGIEHQCLVWGYITVVKDQKLVG